MKPTACPAHIDSLPRNKLGVFPSPLWGGVRGGGPAVWQRWCTNRTTPLPSPPPHQRVYARLRRAIGGREQTSRVAPLCPKLSGTCSSALFAFAALLVLAPAPTLAQLPPLPPQLPIGTNCTPQTTVQVSATAAPDVDAAQPGVQVRIGMKVQVSGVARVERQLANCEITESLAAVTWSLTFTPPGGAATSASLGPVTPQTDTAPSTTSFTAAQEGTYRVTLTGEGANVVRTTSVSVAAVFPPPVLLGECGKLNFLRGHDVGTGFGPPTDFIDAEVIAKFASDPPKAFGFQLRPDANAAARTGMLGLLQDAFNNNWTVCLDYFLVPGKNNGIIIRVALTK
jgi:hypothetical protein